MNPYLKQLQPYPFERLAALTRDVIVRNADKHIALSIGEPKHDTPAFISAALIDNLSGLSAYPATRGTLDLRMAISRWLVSRFQLPKDSIDHETQVLPVNGTREALFAIAQCIVNHHKKPLVLMPNPFYQIYEGAALLAGATPFYINESAAHNLMHDYDAIPKKIWQRCQLLFICSPKNPSGRVLNITQLKKLIELAERHNFVIAADECYSEIYPNEGQPPSGLLSAAQQLGNVKFKRCLVFNSLSKRSNAPGLRSGFVAGDANLIDKFFQYRTYHGCAMSLPTQAASTAAWRDEEHVKQNRMLYRQKILAVQQQLAQVLDISLPEGGFYLWAKLPCDDIQFARNLYAHENVTVLPGSYLSRIAKGVNPGAKRIRIALVASSQDCVEATERIVRFIQQKQYN